MTASPAIDVPRNVSRRAVHADRSDASVLLRTHPYPYVASLAICSDIDETRDVDEFLEIQRFLNTKQPTSMGQGVGLDIGNSFYFYDDQNEFSYFNHDERTRRVILDCIRAGYIDCLHSYGDAAANRDDVLRALEVLQHEQCKLDVWINHFGSRSNLCRKFEYMLGPCEGADPKSDIYHTDLTVPYGIRFAWVGATTRLVGQSPAGSARLSSVADLRHPVASSLNVLKEVRKTALGLRGDERFLLHHHNELTRPLTLDDGQTVHEFMRYCNHPAGVDKGATSRGLAYAISERALGYLKQAGGSMIVYSHLGKNRDCRQPIAPETQSALRNLEREYRDGRILVTTTSRLLNYHRSRRYLDWSSATSGRRTEIHIRAIRDPLFLEEKPDLAHIQGLTFYVSRAAETDVFVSGVEVTDLVRNPADGTGRESVTIPFRPMEFPC